MLCKLPVAITIVNRVSTVFLNMQRKYSVLTTSVTLWVVMLKTKKKSIYLTYTGNKTEHLVMNSKSLKSVFLYLQFSGQLMHVKLCASCYIVN